MQRFFKTGPGEYGEGDVFLSISMPVLRKVAKEFRDLPMGEVVELMKSPLHEVRMFALLVWVDQFRRGDESERAKIHRYYLDHAKWVNNWDLVDLSAPVLMGWWVLDHDRAILGELVASELLWERRIAVVGCFALIRNNEFGEILRLSAALLNDPEDLMHKACGWMLREVGKRDLDVLLRFLDEHWAAMPRTMLRYAIERFPEELRLDYLKRR